MSRAKNPSIAVLKKATGAERIGFGTDTVAVALNARAAAVATIAENASGLEVSEGKQVSAQQWDGQSQSGGGVFVGDGAGDRTEHNGTTEISPTVPSVSSQPGATQNEKIANFLVGTGETSAATPGTFKYIPQEPRASFKKIGATATASEKPREIRAEGGRLYVINQAEIGAGATQPTFQIFDIESGAVPVLLNTINVAAIGDDVRAFDMSDGKAFIVTFGKGSGLNEMYVYDVSNPSSPALLSTTNIGTGSHSIRVLANTAYVTEYQGSALGVWDVTDPTSPRRISQAILTETSVIGNCQRGRYWYTVTNTNPAKMITVDVADPKAPSVVATLTLTGTNARHIDVSGNYAYIVCISSQTLDIVDISDSATPVVVSSTVVPFDAGNLSWCKTIGNRCFTGGENLCVFDVTDKTGPTLEAVAKNRALSFDFWKGRVFCADYIASELITVQMQARYMDYLEVPEVQALHVRAKQVRAEEGVSAASVTAKNARVTDDATVGSLRITGQSTVEAEGNSQSFPAGGGLTKLVFDTEVTDRNGEYDAANGDFVAAKAGRYLVQCAVGIASQADGNTLSLVLYKGGTLHKFLAIQHAGAGESSMVTGALAVDLAKGESLDVRLSSDGAVGPILSNAHRYSYFSIQKIQ